MVISFGQTWKQIQPWTEWLQKTILRGHERVLGIINGIQNVEADPEWLHSATPAIFGNILLPVEPGVPYENNTTSHQNATLQEDIDGSLANIDSRAQAGSCDRKEDCCNVTEDAHNEVSPYSVSICWGLEFPGFFRL